MATFVPTDCFRTRSGVGQRCERILFILALALIASVIMVAVDAFSHTTEYANPIVTRAPPQVLRSPHQRTIDTRSSRDEVGTTTDMDKDLLLEKTFDKKRGRTRHRRKSLTRPRLVSENKRQLQLAYLVAVALMGVVAVLVRNRCSDYFAKTRRAKAQGTISRRLAAPADTLELVCEHFSDGKTGVNNGTEVTDGIWHTKASKGGNSEGRAIHLRVLEELGEEIPSRLMSDDEDDESQRELVRIGLGITSGVVLLFFFAYIFSLVPSSDDVRGTFLEFFTCVLSGSFQQSCIRFVEATGTQS